MADRKLTDIFVVPPISVLDVKQHYWKKRRKEWMSLGIASELGRNDNLLSMSALMKTKHNSTSIFDPVLTECMYKWFTAENDVIYDPFAGGSVRGIVASELNRNYIGVDIRSEQIEHNKIQGNSICSSHIPDWIVADSTTYPINGNSDFVFTCPPYYDLEQYSDLDTDLSRMTTEDFDVALFSSIKHAVDSLHENRFCGIVIGDVRKNGIYMNFNSTVISMFNEVGCQLYNEMILLQEPATAAMRSFNFMNSSRKIAKCHQNILIFVKGDPILATNRLPKFDDKIQNNSTYSTLFVE